MGRLRIRWRGVGKLAAVTAAGLAALQVLPGLLEPPQAPPLAADVGLPGAGETEREIAIREADRRPVELLPEGREEVDRPRQARTSQDPSPATAVIGTTPRRPRARPDRKREPKAGQKHPKPAPPAAAPAPDAPPPAPPPAPEPPPAAPPEPPPPPGDGSVEFAPH